MKLRINKFDILEPLTKVQGITSKKSALSITGNILIKTTNFGISITATNLETGFEGEYPASIESEGAMVINSKKFFEIIKDFPDDVIYIAEIENRWLEIKGNQVEYHIVGMNPDEFPSIPVIEDATFWSIDALTFKQMIEKTIVVSAASDEKRTYINGVYFEKYAKENHVIFRMVSTDNRRINLIEYEPDPPMELPFSENFLVPKKSLNEIQKMINPSEPIQLAIKNNYFIIKKEREIILSRLLEGKFPNYHDAIQKKPDDAIELKKDQFLMMLRRMAILYSDEFKGFFLKFSQDMLEATAMHPHFGESKETMGISYSRNPIEISFNPKLILEAVNAIVDDEVYCYIRTKESPCIIEGKNNKNFLSLIMPIKIENESSE
ncbi:MAG: DNA polymerase III subunit beta [Desulfobacterales bacterium]|nr:DNA polymerase III subunit beta [Desulfobacterales bacterium]